MSDQKKPEAPPVDLFSLEAGVPNVEGAIKPQPKFADRISKRVIVVGLAVVFLMVGLFFAALDNMDQKKKARKESIEAGAKEKPKAAKTDVAVVPKDLTDAPDGADGQGRTAAASLVGAASAPRHDEDPLTDGRGAPSLASGAAPRAAGPAASGVPSLRHGAGPNAQASQDDGLNMGSTRGPSVQPVAQPTPEQQAEAIGRMERAKRVALARSGGLGAKSYSATDEKKGGAAGAASAGLLSSLQGRAAGGGLPASLPPQALGQKTDSEQDEKLSFLKNAGKDDRSYLAHTQMPAVSRNELKRGAYLPLRLEGDINSGQPGMIKARVIEDVYDTVTGCRLLVPAMTVVQGAYDSKVAIGQTRNLVVWNYMGFEDGSELNLAGMQGYDNAGAAGLEADVDNHYARLFGLTFGLSLITAGVQQSMPPPQTGTTAQTPEQALATALAQQYGQLGAQILGKQMQVQPTLRNFAGERFVIMLPSTIVFKKVWRNRCGAGT